jgi:hypothetical protein
MARLARFLKNLDEARSIAPAQAVDRALHAEWRDVLRKHRKAGVSFRHLPSMYTTVGDKGEHIEVHFNRHMHSPPVDFEPKSTGPRGWQTLTRAHSNSDPMYPGTRDSLIVIPHKTKVIHHTGEYLYHVSNAPPEKIMSQGIRPHGSYLGKGRGMEDSPANRTYSPRSYLFADKHSAVHLAHTLSGGDEVDLHTGGSFHGAGMHMYRIKVMHKAFRKVRLHQDPEMTKDKGFFTLNKIHPSAIEHLGEL